MPCGKAGMTGESRFGFEPRDKSLVFERKAYYLFDGRFALRAKLEGGAMSAFEDVKLRVVNFCSHGTTLVKPQDR